MISGWEHLRFWKHGWSETAKAIEHSQNAVFPAEKDWFRALELTPYEKVRCVILGQDPYPTRGHANGLAFSVYPHVRPIPRSLRNIFTEYEDNLGYPSPRTGDLTAWAQQGVLLLNTILTLEENRPLSHAGIGWEKLTLEILTKLAEKDKLAVVLWGKKAQEYEARFDRSKHLILQAPHPSPYSANTGFFGSRPFSRVNDILRGMNVEPIDWRLR